jgi:hypothetical protein
MEDPDQKRQILQGIVQKYPAFAPAWDQLAGLIEEEVEQLSALDIGLAADPDPETRGVLLINRALWMARQGRRKEGVDILGTLILEPGCPLGVEAMAKFALRQLSGP